MWIFIFSVLLATGLDCQGRSAINPSPSDQFLLFHRWTSAAYNYIQNLNCSDVIFTSTDECQRLLDIDQSAMNVYIAYSSTSLATNSKLIGILPDGLLSREGAHHAFLAIDPYPTASFGHLIIVFYIDYGLTCVQCRHIDGNYLENGECISMALKNHCYNLLDRQTRGSQFASRCEINFIPLVQIKGLPPKQTEQLLQCQNIAGFAECPQLRPKNETSSLICDPLDINTHRCQTTHHTVHTKCRMLETCDHGVILTGGWNRDHSRLNSMANIRDVYHMLRNNGFHKSNIKMFFANGAQGIHLVGENNHSVYPSAMKLALRYHIQKICQSTLCADTLVIHLNSPTTKDGTMLLWDVDGNGEVDSSESYQIRELMDDLKDCEAKQVYILSDQSYAGELVNAFSQSKHHSNVIIIGSGKNDEYSWNNEFVKHWTSYRHTHKCITQVHEASHMTVRQSHPTIHDGSDGTLRTTIFGAPCDAFPHYTLDELQKNYLGCQNIPTKIWLSKFLTKN